MKEEQPQFTKYGVLALKDVIHSVAMIPRRFSCWLLGDESVL